jgi:hypothetical protein
MPAQKKSTEKNSGNLNKQTGKQTKSEKRKATSPLYTDITQVSGFDASLNTLNTSCTGITRYIYYT